MEDIKIIIKKGRLEAGKPPTIWEFKFTIFGGNIDFGLKIGIEGLAMLDSFEATKESLDDEADEKIQEDINRHTDEPNKVNASPFVGDKDICVHGDEKVVDDHQLIQDNEGFRQGVEVTRPETSSIPEGSDENLRFVFRINQILEEFNTKDCKSIIQAKQHHQISKDGIDDAYQRLGDATSAGEVDKETENNENSGQQQQA